MRNDIDRFFDRFTIQTTLIERAAIISPRRPIKQSKPTTKKKKIEFSRIEFIRDTFYNAIKKEKLSYDLYITGYPYT